MIQINITKFRNNIKKYSEIAKDQDLEITNRGKILFIVKGPGSNREDAFRALLGAAKSETDYRDILKEKLSEL